MSSSEWNILNIGNSGLLIIDGDRGKNYPKKEELTNEGYCIFLSTNNLIDDKVDLSSCNYISEEKYNELGRGKVIQNDIVITTRGNGVGKLGLYNYNHIARINSGLLIIRNETNIFDTIFLYYMFTSDFIKNQFKSLMSGSAQPQLPIRDIRKVNIKIPPIKEQKMIANMLSILDKKIDNNNLINKNLEEMAQAIFKQWFVDFEFPNEDGDPYKSSGGEMVESEIGMIPRGWNVKALDEIAEYLNGLAMQKYRPNETDARLPVLKIKELRQGRTDESSDVCSNEIPEQYIINDGDVIFSWSGSLLVDIWCGGKCGLNQHLFKVTSSKYEKWFYNCWTKYHLDKFIRIAEGKATTMGHIKRGDLANSLTVIPDKKVYDKANKIFKPLLDRMIKARMESRKLEVMRDKLLPKLMSGEIRVPLNN